MPQLVHTCLLTSTAVITNVSISLVTSGSLGIWITRFVIYLILSIYHMHVYIHRRHRLESLGNPKNAFNMTLEELQYLHEAYVMQLFLVRTQGNVD